MVNFLCIFSKQYGHKSFIINWPIYLSLLYASTQIVYSEILSKSALTSQCQDLCLNSVVPFALPAELKELRWDFKLSACNQSCQYDECCHVQQCQLGCTSYYAGVTTQQKACKDYVNDTNSMLACTQGLTVAEDGQIAQLHGFVQSTKVTVRYDQSGDQILVLYNVNKGDLDFVSTFGTKYFAQRRQLRFIANQEQIWTAWITVNTVAFDQSGSKTIKNLFDGPAALQRGTVYQYRLLAVSDRLQYTSATPGFEIRAPADVNHALSSSIEVTHSLQLTANQFVLCWKVLEAGQALTNQSVRVVLAVKNAQSAIKDQTTSSECIGFNDLTVSLTYEVQLSLSQQTAVLAKKSFTIKPVPNQNGPGTLMYANTTTVYQLRDVKDDLIFDDSPLNIIFQIPTNSGPASINDITAIECGNERTIFVGTGAGRLYVQTLQAIPSAPTLLLDRNAGLGPAVLTISADWLNERVYWVQNGKLLSCTYKSCDQTASLVLPNGYNPLSIKVDAWNGYMYLLVSVGPALQLYRMSLPDFRASPKQQTFIINSDQLQRIDINFNGQLKSVTALTLNLAQAQLIVSTRDSLLLTYSLIDKSIDQFRTESVLDRARYPRFIVPEMSSIVTDGSTVFLLSQDCGSETNTAISQCMYQESLIQATSKWQFIKYQTDVLHAPKAMAWWGSSRVPNEINLPQNTAILTSSTSARISWTVPAPMPFQSPSLSLPYDTAISLRNSVGTVTEREAPASKFKNDFLNVPGLQPGQLYTMQLQSCLNVPTATKKCSSKTDFISSRTFRRSPDELDVIYADSTSEKLDATGNKLGAVQFVPDLASATVAVSSEQVNRIYWADQAKVQTSIYKSTDPKQIETVLNRPAKYLAQLERFGLLYVADEYSVNMYRMTGAYLDQKSSSLYSCNPLSEACPELKSIVVNQENATIFYWLQYSDEKVEVWTQDAFGRQEKKIYAQNNQVELPDIKQMYYVGDKFIMLTSNGQIGVMDSLDQPISYMDTDQKVTQLLLAFRADNASSISDDADAPNLSKIQMLVNLNKVSIKWDIGHAQTNQFTIGTSAAIYRLVVTNSDQSASSKSIIDYRLLANQYVVPPELYSILPTGGRVKIEVTAYTPWAYSTESATVTVPVLPPPPPKSFQGYLARQKQPEGIVYMIDFEWTLAESTKVTSYQFNCSEARGAQITNQIFPATQSRYQLELSSDQSGTVNCELRSLAALNGASNSLSVEVPISKDTLNPLITLVAFDPSSRQFLLKTHGGNSNANGSTDIIRVSNKVKYTTWIGTTLYGIDSQATVVTITDTIAKTSVQRSLEQADQHPKEVVGLTADWNGASLYVISRQQQSRVEVYRVVLPLVTPLTNKQGLTMIKINKQLKQVPADNTPFLLDPFSASLYYHTFGGVLVSSSLEEETESSQDLTSLNCLGGPNDEINSALLALQFNSESDRRPYLILANENSLVRYDTAGTGVCEKLMDLNENNVQGVTLKSVSVAGDTVYLLTQTGSIISKSAANSKATTLNFGNRNAEQLHALNRQYQPFADISCLQLGTRPPKPDIVPYGRTGIEVQFDRPSPTSACQGILTPPTAYSILYSNTANTSDYTSSQYQYGHSIKLTNVVKEQQTYQITAVWANLYSTKTPSSSQQVLFTAGQGFPSAPRNLRSSTIGPSAILLTWTVPEQFGGLNLEQIEYSVYSFSEELLVKSCSSTESQGCFAIVDGLKANKRYNLQVLARKAGTSTTSEIDPSGTSAAAQSDTFSAPGTINVREYTAYSILVSWRPTALPRTQIINQVRVQTINKGAKDEWVTGVTLFNVAQSADANITDLMAGTTYAIRYQVTYKNDDLLQYLSTNEYYYNSAHVQQRTKSSVPLAPTNVQIESVGDSQVIKWEAPVSDGGAVITGYTILQRSDDSSPWSVYAPNLPPSSLQFTLTDYNAASQYSVQAVNANGASPVLIAVREPTTSIGSIILIVVIIIFLILLLLVVIFICWYRHRGQHKKKLHPSGRSLRLAHVPTALHVVSNEQKESQSAVDLISTAEIRSLPHVPRSCITVARQLGKGAFGEVYEGLACNLPRVGPKSVRVAIKTLRPGCQSADRVKFLKEALLMNSFDHKNIVRLLGVCIEDVPHWLVLELVEGGDLLSFLRESRPTEVMPSQVSLRDLTSMIKDVCEGCVYLEQQRHVHRDLAARNCLVSTRNNSSSRIVKIADFGLARDVYEVDYYRVDGHGLLPIRWMAPESLIDGVFTIKTDVWSFGVVMWEIMTLGQQPYHGRTNWEVLNFVRLDGRLKKPDYCPAILYSVMSDCWIIPSANRPSFTDMFSKIERVSSLTELCSEDPYPPAPLAGSLPSGSLDKASLAAGASRPQPHQSPKKAGHSNAAFIASPTDGETPGKADNGKGSAEGNVRIFATAGSAKFARGDAATGSMRDQKGIRASRRRRFSFKSLRKEKKPPPRPPSKEDLTQLEREKVRDERSSADMSNYGPATRTQSRFSSTGESFTTNRADYDAVLFKGTTNKQLTDRYGGQGNSAYSPTGEEENNYYITSNTSRGAASPSSDITNIMDMSTDSQRYTRTPTKPTERQHSYNTRRPRRQAPGRPDVRTPSTDYTDIDLSRPTSSVYEEVGVHQRDRAQAPDFTMSIPISPTASEAHRRSQAMRSAKPSDL